MRKFPLLLALAALTAGLVPRAGAELTPRTDREWRTLLKSLYSAEMTRGEVERKLGVPVLFEFTDRTYGNRRDVFYDLNPDWTAFYVYRRPDRASDYDLVDPSAMVIASRPILIRRYPKFLDDLKTGSMPLRLPPEIGIMRRDTCQ